MKKQCVWFAVFLLLVCFVFAPSEARAKEVSNGKCGDQLTWVLADDGVLTISGKGEMNDFGRGPDKQAPWSGKGVTTVVINNGVTSIGEFAFDQCSGIIGVTIADTVTSIGKQAFTKCTSLANITIPGSVTSIGEFAFYGCTALANITFEDGLDTIGDNAFFDCTALTSITIPDSVTQIGESAFYNCAALTTVTIGEGIQKIGSEAFRNCKALTNVTFINKSTENQKTCSISDGAFMDCSNLSSLILEEGIKSIGKNAFYGCNNLTNISIPNSVTTVGQMAFGYCTRLRVIMIGAGIAEIEDRAFYGCNIWHVLYKGSDSLWKRISIGSDNHALKNATRHDTCTGEEIVDLENRVCATCLANCTHTEGTWQVIQDATCAAEGLEKFTCSYCSATQEEVISKLECSYGRWIEVKAPSTEEYGVEERVCSACGNAEQRQVAKLEPAPTEPAKPTEPLSTAPSGNKDDNSGNSVVLVAVAVGMMVAIVALVWAKRRASKKKTSR